tara:strand:+ start:1715 stop:1960 length:246 start_codon:yes stop_codon:yes gene_type:complete
MAKEICNKIKMKKLKNKYLDVIKDIKTFIDNNGEVNHPKEYIALEEIIGYTEVYDDMSKEQFEQIKKLISKIKPKQKCIEH